MSANRYIKRIIFIALMMISSSVMSTEILVWDKKPLTIKLEIGKERLIEFEDNIEIDIPQTVHNRIKIDAAAGVAYITSHAPFPKSRIAVTLVSTNEKIFIDIFSVESSSSNNLELVKVISNSTKTEALKQKQALFESSANVTVKELVQYAAHDFFAPSRLKVTNKPIQETVINKSINLDILFLGRSAGLFELKPLKQYRTMNYTLTAIVVTNKTAENQILIYKDIYPNFVAVSSQHKYVGPAESPSQSTILYLVTEMPLTDDSVYAKDKS